VVLHCIVLVVIYMYWYKIVITKPTVTYVIRNLYKLDTVLILYVPASLSTCTYANTNPCTTVGGLKRCSILKDSELGPILALSEPSPFTVDLY